MNAPDRIIIRAGVVPEDIEPCVEIWVHAVELRDGTVDTDAMAQRVRSSFGQPIVRFAVATSPRAGFVLVEAGRPEPTEALLRFLAVHPDGVGSGVGTALLAHAVAYTRLGGFRSLTLEVRTNNLRAIKLQTRRVRPVRCGSPASAHWLPDAVVPPLARLRPPLLRPSGHPQIIGTGPPRQLGAEFNRATFGALVEIREQLSGGRTG